MDAMEILYFGIIIAGLFWHNHDIYGVCHTIAKMLLVKNILKLKLLKVDMNTWKYLYDSLYVLYDGVQPYIHNNVPTLSSNQYLQTVTLYTLLHGLCFSRLCLWLIWKQ